MSLTPKQTHVQSAARRFFNDPDLTLISSVAEEGGWNVVMACPDDIHAAGQWKGQVKKGHGLHCFVCVHSVALAESRYEAETGKCRRCLGRGCRLCGGTGKAI